MHRIEAVHGRDRPAERRWGPRRLDLDLLLFEERIIDEPGLTVPHPRLHVRTFVLEPLAQIAPNTVHPRLNQPIQALRDRLLAGGLAEYREPATGSDQKESLR